VTLLISIYFVLRWMSRIPVIGNGLPVIGGFGYNTLGGVILVMLALQLPLGIWLMKGFFDNVPWDMERAALIDGCSRFRVWREILLPQIKPGIAALSIFSFISGWNEFLIPYTYIADQQKSTIAAYLNSLVGDTAPVNYSQVAAVGLFQLIPVLIFFIFTQEYLLSIFAGGSKGGT
jgi:inositol-phosphate transport system permease protein